MKLEASSVRLDWRAVYRWATATEEVCNVDVRVSADADIGVAAQVAPAPAASRLACVIRAARRTVASAPLMILLHPMNEWPPD